MTKTPALAAAVGLALALCGSALAQTGGASVERTAAPVADPPLAYRTVGRAVAQGAGLRRQWPGTYFEAAFRGRSAGFRLGPGEVALHVLLDGRPIADLVRPAPGDYRVRAAEGGDHRLRLEVASESQAGPTDFGGFFAPAGSSLPAPAPLQRQLEFVGDSHTVGYGITSPTRACTKDEIWTRTDTSKGFAALLGARLHADYRVNAISGRGVVRNYDGFKADTLPQAYPYALFDRSVTADDAGWRPQAVVVALGTNDFSTPLRPGEPWPDRQALYADYERTYEGFLQDLRRRYPRAQIIVWATDLDHGEVEAEARKVVGALNARGDGRVRFIAFHGLAFSACDGHPSLDDNRRIADGLEPLIRSALTVADR